MGRLAVTAVTATAVTATAALLLYRWLTRPRKPFIDGIPLRADLHAPILGVGAMLKEGITGMRLLCVDNADKETGLSSFYIVNTPVVSVLKAEHVRKIVLASNYRQPITLLAKHLGKFLGFKALVLLMDEEWKVHRRLMTQAFHWENLRGMVR